MNIPFPNSCKEVRLLSPRGQPVVAETEGIIEGYGFVHLRAEPGKACEHCAHRADNWTDRRAHWEASPRRCSLPFTPQQFAPKELTNV